MITAYDCFILRKHNFVQRQLTKMSFVSYAEKV